MADDPVFPRWLERTVAIIAVAGIAAAAAYGVFFLFLVLGVGGDAFLIGAIIHYDVVVLVAAGCGLLVALAFTYRRRAAIAAALLLFMAGTAVVLIASIVPGPDFSAERFRTGGDEEREFHAYRAVEEKVLLGMTPAELRSTLGPPDRRSKRRPLWIWSLGMINDSMGPGDSGALYVEMENGRVTNALVDQVAPSANRAP